MSEVIVIFRDQLDSYNGIRTFAAVAENTEAAMRWVQDEVDGKHESGHSYAAGKPAEWWVKDYPLFKLVSTPIQS